MLRLVQPDPNSHGTPNPHPRPNPDLNPGVLRFVWLVGAPGVRWYEQCRLTSLVQGAILQLHANEPSPLPRRYEQRRLHCLLRGPAGLHLVRVPRLPTWRALTLTLTPTPTAPLALDLTLTLHPKHQVRVPRLPTWRLRARSTAVAHARAACGKGTVEARRLLAGPRLVERGRGELIPRTISLRTSSRHTRST